MAMRKTKPTKENMEVVKKFNELIEKYPIIGAINMENLPTRQLQQMRSSLRGNVEILMTKRRLMKIAIEHSKEKREGIEQIVPYLKGMPALLFTKENPFKLYKITASKKSSAPAKAGQTAPKDILVKAGATPFAPGPIIGELGQVGIKAGIEGGKVAIKSDCVVVKEGEIIKANVAGILSRLGIEPMEIGLNITAVYENGTIYTKDVLAVDEKEYLANITEAARSIFNLAVEIAYPAKDTVEFLIQKAYNDGMGLAIEQNIMADAVAEELVAKAEREAIAVKEEINL